MKLRVISIVIMLMVLIPQYVAAEDVQQTVTVDVSPPEGNYTKLANIADENNSWLDDMRFTWTKYTEKYGFQGRIIDEGVIPSVIQVYNSTTPDDVYALSYSFVTGQDIMSGASRAIFRLPLATPDCTTNISATIYEVQSNVMHIKDFSSDSVTIDSPGRVLKFVADIKDIQSVNITYPANLTGNKDLHMVFYYFYVRGPLERGAYYVVHANIHAKNVYLLVGWKNQTGYYGVGNKKYVTPYTAPFTFMAISGMSDNIFGLQLTENERTYYIISKSIDFNYNGGTEAYFNLYIPIYSQTALTLPVTIVFWRHDSTDDWDVPEENVYLNLNLIKGVKTYHIFHLYSDTASHHFVRYEIFLKANDNVYLYGAEAPGMKILSVNDTSSNYWQLVTPRRVYYSHTSVCEYDEFSYTNYTFVNIKVPGIQVPKIIYHYIYVYSILDFTVLAPLEGLSTLISFLTFGHVNLNDLFYKYVWKPVYNAAKWVINWVANKIKGFVKAWLAPFIHTVIKLVTSAAEFFSTYILQFLIYVFNVAAYVIFLWPWIVLMRGLVLFQKQGVNGMLDYYASYVDKVTSIMAKLIPKRRVI